MKFSIDETFNQNVACEYSEDILIESQLGEFEQIERIETDVLLVESGYEWLDEEFWAHIESD